MAVIIPHTTRATGTVLTAAIYNADHQTHITNANSLNTELAGVSGVGASTGIIVSNGAGVISGRSIAVEQGLTIANANGVSGSPTIGVGPALVAPGVIVLGDATAGAIQTVATTSQLQLRGGTNANTGATLYLFAESHPSQASDILFTVGAGLTRYQWDNSAGNHDWYDSANALAARLNAAQLTVFGSIASTGSISSDINIVGAAGVFNSFVSVPTVVSSGQLELAAGSNFVVLRPNGSGVVAGQWAFDTTGSISGLGTINAGAFVATGTIRTSGNIHSAGKTSADPAVVGGSLVNNGQVHGTVANDTTSIFNRIGAEGVIMQFRGDNVTEGTIAEAGGVISYNAFFGSHWSQLADGSRPKILRGTICETIDQMCKWPKETNEQLCCFKVSDVPGSTRPYGVFAAWDDDDDQVNDAYIGSLGAFVIRIQKGEKVEGGDWIESAGNGCGRKFDWTKPDPRKHVATITANYVVERYKDGSYLVPCTLHCG